MANVRQDIPKRDWRSRAGTVANALGKAYGALQDYAGTMREGYGIGGGASRMLDDMTGAAATQVANAYVNPPHGVNRNLAAAPWAAVAGVPGTAQYFLDLFREKGPTRGTLDLVAVDPEEPLEPMAELYDAMVEAQENPSAWNALKLGGNMVGAPLSYMGAGAVLKGLTKPAARVAAKVAPKVAEKVAAKAALRVPIR